ncbi:MAG: hypothetical protein JSS02_32305 [Planctomycetes bacterium]|nr:hypothetical protein [Planctomycetota bacterium]
MVTCNVRRWMKWVAMCVFAAGFATTAEAQYKGPSSSATPYVLPLNPAKYSTTSILTVGDTAGGYKMAGIPDGLGAFDNGNGTFTVLMNHEIASGVGTGRTHNPGGNGAFVSEWIIDKYTLKVLGGQDLIQTVKTDTGTVLTGSALNFSRFCSADLPATSAFYNANTGLGTQARIFMNGEESGSSSRALANIVTGSEAHTSYVLSKFSGTGASWENLLANPNSGNKTIVAASNDTSPSGKNYFYVGTKTDTGTEIDKAGLTNGTLFTVKVDGVTAESRANALGTSTPDYDGHFTLSSNLSEGTSFLRSEDGVWDPNSPNDYYFVTTDRLDTHDDPSLATQAGNSRLWHMHFDDLEHPELGGRIEALLTGISTDPLHPDLTQPNMMDNITMDQYGNILIQEDVGNAAHNGKVFIYNVNTKQLTMIADHDQSRFGDIGQAATSPFNRDEESSGIIDVSSIFGKGHYLFVDQAHYSTGDAYTVEGGQLLLLRVVPEPKSVLLFLTGAAVLVGGNWLSRRRRMAAL